MPTSTPSRATPENAASQRTNSERRTRYRRRTPTTSIRPMAAVMTIAASIGRGRSLRAPGAATSSTAMATAPTSGVSWERAPAATATGVREALLEMAKPWKRPAARLAAPRARSSWLGSTVSPRWAARDCDSTVVSATATRAMPRAPLNSAPRSARSTAGRANPGRPLGSTPRTCTPASSRLNTATAAIPARTATMTPGTARQNRRRSRTTTMPVTPTARAARFTCPSATPRAKSLISVSSPRPSIEKPHSLGSCPTRMVTAIPHR
jgi:hypothetical protein